MIPTGFLSPRSSLVAGAAAPFRWFIPPSTGSMTGGNGKRTDGRIRRNSQKSRKIELGTAVAYITPVMKMSEQFLMYSFASGGGLLILGLGMGIAYLLFMLTGAIV